jgi:hypothetical protein
MIKEREGVQIPSTISNFKEHKQRMIETISQITPIQQGMSPGSNMPFKAIAELGARTDVRMKKAAQKLELFLKQINKLRINRFAQFYTTERYYRIKGDDGELVEGTFQKDEMFDKWTREQSVNEETGMSEERIEFFIPDFDINVQILSSKPNDRNYYTSTAFQMFNLGLMTGEDLWETLEEGKFPLKDDVLQHIYAQDAVKQMIAKLGELPQENQQQITQMLSGLVDKLLTPEQQSGQPMQQPMQQGQPSAEMMEGGAMDGSQMPPQGY